MRAMNMLGKAEEQYTSLINKKTTVENDKSKIRKVIEELDVKKKAELRAAWEKVNKDFGSIFAMLLPGMTPKFFKYFFSSTDNLPHFNDKKMD